ncbi:MAG TPA: hypothetical protein VJT15_19565 [Pyrinomonadaceae bacterium]|nr:hypothetical protein [Pyrinomonadaceae bacterium]
MRIKRLIAVTVVLLLLTLTTMTSIQQKLTGVDSTTVSAQQDDPIIAKQEGGLSSVTAPETESRADPDAELYLDADEVEKRALAEQSGDTSARGPSRIPLSFRHLAVPLPGGVDHVVAGVGTRNTGGGVIRLRGVPPGASLVGALLVWGEIAAAVANPYTLGFGADCSTLNTYNVPPNGSGSTTQPCWNGAGTFFSYAANVTNAIVPGINGDYRVKGLRSAITDNRCPWSDGLCAGSGNALPMSEGASLIVFYSSPCVPRGSQLYIALGPRMFSGPHSVVHPTAPAINGNLSNLKHSRIGADGQVGVANCGLRSIPSISDERTWIENPNTPGSIQIKGDGGGLNRDSDWNGSDGEPLNKLWDTHTDVFGTGAFLAQNGGNSYRVRYQAQGDCIVWVAHILSVR